MPGSKTALYVNKQSGGMFAVEDQSRSTGTRFFVHSGTGTDSAGNGANPTKPLATIDYAVGLCTANKGDIIHVMPGHAETVIAANGIDIDVAGVTLVGEGEGDLKPTITMGTATTATVRFNAKNCRIIGTAPTRGGFRFVGDIDSLVKFIDVNKNFTLIEDCEFVTSSTKEATSFINLATTFDYLTVRRCRFEQPTDPTGTDGAADTGALFCVDSEYILFEDCWFQGNFETAIFHNRTTKCRSLWVKNCWGIQLLSGAEPFQLVTDADGAMLGGGFITPAETAVTEATLVGTVGDKFFVLQPGSFGNDGAAGGQGGVIVATAS